MADQNRTLEIDVKLDNKDLKRKAAEAKNLFSGIGKTARRLGPILAGAFGTAVLVKYVKQTLAVNDVLAKTADRIGVTTEAMAGFNHAARLAGMSAEQMGTTLQLMNRNVSDAAAGIGTAKDAIQSLGLSAAQLRSAGPEASFLQIVEAIEGVENAADRSSIAMDIFGRSGGQVLNLTADGLQKARIEAEKFGTAISREDAAQMEAFNDEMTRLSEVTQGTANKLTIALLPALSMLLDIAPKVVENVTNIGNALAEAIYGPIAEGANKTWAEELEEVNGKLAELERIAKGNGNELWREAEAIDALIKKREGLLRITGQEATEKNKDEEIQKKLQEAEELASIEEKIQDEKDRASLERWYANREAQKEAKIQADAEDLQLAEEKAAAEEAIRQAQIQAEENKVALFANLMTLAQGQSKKAFEVAKGLAIANATISTFQSAVDAYKGMVSVIPGPPGIVAGVVAAAAAVTSGLANVKKIKATKFNSGGGGGGGGAYQAGGAGASSGGAGGVPGLGGLSANLPTQPAQDAGQTIGPQITVVNGNTLLGKMVEEQVIPAINDALRRGVSLDLEFT